jgi:hypothetical protein
MSVWKNNKDGKTVRRNKIATQFAWQAIEMLEAPAFRVMSLSARRVIDRIQIEHASHGGKENGKLPVTFRDFNEYGIHWNSIAPAIREAAALGFIRITQEGIASNKEFRIPNMFALTHLATDKEPKPTEDWRRIKTVEEAETIAAEARKAPARFAKFKRKKKAGLRYGKRIEPEYGKRIEEGQNLNTESVSQATTESVSLSISREESRAAAKDKPKPTLKLVRSAPQPFAQELAELFGLAAMSSAPAALAVAA